MDTASQTMDTASQSLDPARCQSLGLGRGLNVTDTYMWRNKSSLQMCEVQAELNNVTLTEESGDKEEYEEEVATISMEQQKIALSLDDPTSHVKIGMDAQQIRTASETVSISGIRVKTRTIAFTATFSDIPRFSHKPKELLSVKADVRMYTQFEDNISTWIYDRVLDRYPAEYSKHEQSTDSIPQQLLEYIEKANDEGKKGIFDDCKAFVQNFGLTHYVSAVELGAIEYQVVTSSLQKTKRKIGAEIGASQFASGKLSASKEKVQVHKSRIARMIGRIMDNGRVTRNSEDEAVIGFQIRPIYELVHNHILQTALQRAVQSYILKRGDTFEGPFLISCTVGREDVYWVIEDNVIRGKDDPDKASQFYITQTGDSAHPNEFLIAYWVGHRKKREEIKYPLSTMRDEYDSYKKSKPSLPLYVSSGFSFGRSNGPLQLKPAVQVHQARFCLHSRVQTRYSYLMCRSTPVSHREWKEGEQFYINCSRQSLLIDGYVAMLKNEDQIFETTTLSFIKESNKLGMLFRLNPPPPMAKETTTSGAKLSKKLRMLNFPRHPPIASTLALETTTSDAEFADKIVASGGAERAPLGNQDQDEDGGDEEVSINTDQLAIPQRGLTTHAQQFEQYFGKIDD